MILVTGAAGKTGRAIIQAVVAKGQPVRGLVHRREQVALLKQSGVQEVVVGDMRVQATMNQATRGVEMVYHICPNVHPEEIAIGETAIRAARSEGIERFVYHSVLHPQTEAMPHHWRKLRVEEKLIESGLSYTILQPAAYMQNVLAQWDGIVEQGVYLVPYAERARLSMVDLQDVAEVAANVLAEAGHEGATYELSGPEALTQKEVATILGQQIGREVQVEVVPVGAWERQARESGLDDDRIETLVKMFRYYERNGLMGNPGVLEWLLGRSATRFASFVQRTVEECQA